MYGRWYELDGFVVRQNERHRMIRRMKCDRMNELSDHKPKKVVICVEKRRWRAVNGERKRRIKREVLRDSEKKEEYKESMRVKWNERMERETGESSRMQWKNLVEVMKNPTQLRRARRNMRQFLRRVEREWWRERIEECENACNLGRMCEMYTILKEIGRK